MTPIPVRGETVDEANGVVEQWVRLARRRWKSGGLVSLPLFALSAVLVLFARPVYRTEARVRLGEPPPAGGVTPSAGFFGLFRMGGDPFSNDLELLESRTVTEALVLDAGLNAVVVAPRGWDRDSLFEAFSTTDATDKATFAATWRDDDSVAVELVAPRDSLIRIVAPGEPVAFGGVVAVFQRWRAEMPREINVVTLPYREAVRRARSRVVVERARRDANVVELRFDDPDRGIGRRALGSAIRRFIELRASLQRRESGVTVDSLRRIREATMGELRVAETRLEAFQQRTRLIAPGEQGGLLMERFSETFGTLERAEAELDAISRILAASDTAAQATATQLVANPDLLESPALGELLVQLSNLRLRRTELAARRQPTNRDLEILDRQIESLDRELRALVRNRQAALQETVRRGRARLVEIDEALADLSAQSVELARYQRDVRILSEMVVLTEQRLRQEELREALTFANVQVIDPPAALFKPVWPRKKLGLLVGLMLAGGFATLTMVVRDKADRALRRADQVRAATGAPVLGVVERRADGAMRADVATFQEALRVVARRAPANGRVTVVPVGESTLGTEIVTVLDGERGEACSTPLRAVGALSGFGSAAVATAGEGPVALTFEWGRASYDQVERAARLVTEAGGTVVGAIVVTRSARQTAAFWD